MKSIFFLIGPACGEKKKAETMLLCNGIKLNFENAGSF